MLLWETCVLESQAYAELSFIRQGLSLEKGSFSDLMKEVT
jgi:hypothetical protein